MSFTSSKPKIQLPEFHPIANIFPLMEGDEFDGLLGDIQRRGFRIDLGGPIWMYEGKILDGRNRVRASAETGVVLEDNCFKTFEGTKEEAIRLVIQANIHRRHLRPGDRREFLKQLLGMNPYLSDRAIAKMGKTHHHAVAVVRKEEEGRGNLSHVEKRTDTKGRNQPATKPQTLQMDSKDHLPIPELEKTAESKPSKPHSKSAPPPLTRLIDAWRDATAEERTAFFAEIKLTDLYKLAPKTQKDELAGIIRNMDREAKTDGMATSKVLAIAAH
jgi:hypothetical protein